VREGSQGASTMMLSPMLPNGALCEYTSMALMGCAGMSVPILSPYSITPSKKSRLGSKSCMLSCISVTQPLGMISPKSFAEDGWKPLNQSSVAWFTHRFLALWKMVLHSKS
jgi:hypothetical protein